jgi:hypothetical protein
LYWEGKDISPNSDKSIMINVVQEGESGYYTLQDGSSVDGNSEKKHAFDLPN